MQQLDNKRSRELNNIQKRQGSEKNACRIKDYEEYLAQQVEDACRKCDIKALYSITRQIGGRPSNNNGSVKDNKGVQDSYQARRPT